MIHSEEQNKLVETFPPGRHWTYQTDFQRTVLNRLKDVKENTDKEQIK
jgi:hypothetical protein